jgi:hypothetical protein
MGAYCGKRGFNRPQEATGQVPRNLAKVLPGADLLKPQMWASHRMQKLVVVD